MIIRLQSASLNHFLLKLSGELPVHIGEKRETARLFEEHRDAIGSLMTEIMQPPNRWHPGVPRTAARSPVFRRCAQAVLR